MSAPRKDYAIYANHSFFVLFISVSTLNLLKKYFNTIYIVTHFAYYYVTAPPGAIFRKYRKFRAAKIKTIS